MSDLNNIYVSGGGWTCRNCGTWVPNGTSHTCFWTPGGTTKTLGPLTQCWHKFGAIERIEIGSIELFVQYCDYCRIAHCVSTNELKSRPVTMDDFYPEGTPI